MKLILLCCHRGAGTENHLSVPVNDKKNPMNDTGLLFYHKVFWYSNYIFKYL